MDSDLIFGAETGDMLTGGASGDPVQLAAAPAASLPPFDDALARPFDAAQVVIPQGENVVREPVTPGEVVELPFPADSQFLARIDNGNLAIKVGDVTVILQGYVEAAGQAAPVIEASNGQPLDIATILANTDPNIDIQTAAGPAAGPQGQGADNTGAFFAQFGEGGGLGGFEGAGAQDATDGIGGGTVDQTGTLFVPFGFETPNAFPLIHDDAYNTDEDVALTVPAGTGLLSNDSDPDGDPLTVTSVTAPQHGTVVVNPDGSFTYTPNKDYNGPDSFDYTASDGKGGTGTATVNITVKPVNDAPVAANDDYLAIKDKPLVVTAANGVLKNDTDVDGDTLSASKLTDPAHGTVTLNADGSFTYIPTAGYFGADSFTYQVDDGHGGKSSATVDLYVDAPPQWAGGFFFTSYDEDTPNHPQPLGWTIKDLDDNQHTITVDPNTLPDGVTYDSGTKTINFDTQGKYDYLAPGETANFTIRFTITDAHGGSTTKDVTLQIIGKADVADAVDDTVLTNVGVMGTFVLPEWALLANDKDASTEALTGAFDAVVGVAGASWTSGGGTDGILSLIEDGTLGASLKYQVKDGSFAAISVTNQEGGALIGTSAHEIIVSDDNGTKIDGKGGKDVILGGNGDDTVIFHTGDVIQGGHDSIDPSKELATAPTRGDVVVVDHDVNFAKVDISHFGGIETISTAAADGGTGAQNITIDAGTVIVLSDHTILPPGGVFTNEMDTLRIDGDAVDQLYLSISKDPAGTAWVDTGVDVNGYSVYAHETTGGTPGTADAYVMVSNAIPTANVHLNADQP